MDSLKYIKPIKLFAEAEKMRLHDVMCNIREHDSPQMVRARYEMRKSDIRTIPRIPQMVLDGIEEEYCQILKDGELSHNAKQIINNNIESMMISFVKELIRQGLIVCEIKDSRYDPRRFCIELSAVVGVPKRTQKRLDIDITE